MANGAYPQSNEGLEARKKILADLNSHFNAAVEEIQDPGRRDRQMQQLRDNPLFGAGVRALERAKWDMAARQQAAADRAQAMSKS